MRFCYNFSEAKIGLVLMYAFCMSISSTVFVSSTTSMLFQNWLAQINREKIQIKGMTFELASFKCIFSRLMKCKPSEMRYIFYIWPKDSIYLIPELLLFLSFIYCYSKYLLWEFIAVENIFEKMFLLIFFASVFILAFKWVNANLYFEGIQLHRKARD